MMKDHISHSYSLHRTFLFFAVAWLTVFFLISGKASAAEGNADVTKVVATDRGTSGWTFAVTVSHPDTGWEDYADGWDVVDDKGMVLKRVESDPFTRLLLHPHVNEQPFTRSVSGIKVEDGTRFLTVRAHDLVDGFGGKEITLDLGRRSGPGYTINRP